MVVIIVGASVWAWYTYYYSVSTLNVKELVFGMKVIPVGLEPVNSPGSPEITINKHMYENLVTWTEVSASGPIIEPGLAESWEPYNATTFLFHLRKGVKFHCGAEFTAKDIVFSRERYDDPNITRLYTGGQWYGLDNYQIIDNYTILIGADNILGAFFLYAAQHHCLIICSECATKWGQDFGSHPCGTGPYKLEEFVLSERVIIERNENYWGQKPAIQRIIWKPITDDLSRIASLQT